MAFKLNENNSEEMSEINVTPFIDVMLVLLIIFMATIPLATVNIPINLPAVTSEDKPVPTHPVILSLTPDNALYLGQEKIDLSRLETAIQTATQGNKETVIFLKVDKEVKYEEVMQVMDKLRMTGYLKVGLVGATPSQERP